MHSASRNGRAQPRLLCFSAPAVDAGARALAVAGFDDITPRKGVAARIGPTDAIGDLAAGTGHQAYGDGNVTGVGARVTRRVRTPSDARARLVSLPNAGTRPQSPACRAEIEPNGSAPRTPPLHC